MAYPFSQTEADFPVDDYHVPVEYKIVDLPIISLPQMNTLKTYPCKIYKKVALPQLASVAEADYEWKRRCHGRIKFVQMNDTIVVAAYEYGSCHNRLKEQPITHETLYNLHQSQEFAYNWTYTNLGQEVMSIALTSAADFVDFRNEWENAKTVNDLKLEQAQEEADEENEWIKLIDEDIFM